MMTVLALCMTSTLLATFLHQSTPTFATTISRPFERSIYTYRYVVVGTADSGQRAATSAAQRRAVAELLLLALKRCNSARMHNGIAWLLNAETTITLVASLSAQTFTVVSEYAY